MDITFTGFPIITYPNCLTTTKNAIEIISRELRGIIEKKLSKKWIYISKDRHYSLILYSNKHAPISLFIHTRSSASGKRSGYPRYST